MDKIKLLVDVSPELLNAVSPFLKKMSVPSTSARA